LASLLDEFESGGYTALQAGLHSVGGPGYWGRALAWHHRTGRSRNWFGVVATIFERQTLLDHGFDARFLSGEDIDLRWRLRRAGAKIGVSKRTVVEHRFDDTFAFALGQWLADGRGLARMVDGHGRRGKLLLGLPLAAARLFAPDAVGLAAAAVSAMMLATQVAQLGLGSAVISRLPAHRRRPGPLLDAAFSLTVIAGIAAAALLLLVAAGFSDELRVVASDPLYAVLFAGASLFGTLGILLDQTNTALRRGDQALVRGVVFGVGALAGLIAIAVVAGRGDARAIFAPWLLAGLAGAVIGVVQLRRSSGYAPRPRLERAP